MKNNAEFSAALNKALGALFPGNTLKVAQLQEIREDLTEAIAYIDKVIEFRKKLELDLLINTQQNYADERNGHM